MTTRYPIKFPQNKPRFILLDDCSTGFAAASVSNTFTVASDTTYVKTGTASQRITVGNGTAVTHQGSCKKTFAAVDMRDAAGNIPRAIMLKAFLHTGQANPSAFTINIRIGTSDANYYSAEMNGAGGVIGVSDQLATGWNNFIATDQDGAGLWKTTGAPSWAAITQIVLFVSMTGATYTGRIPFVMTLDSVYYAHSIKNTTGILTFSTDDSSDDGYAYADYLYTTYGFKTTHYTLADRVDTAGGCTTANLVALKAQGHDIQIHGGGGAGFGRPDNWTYSAATAAADVDNCIAYLTANNLIGDVLHASYPQGKFNADAMAMLQARNVQTCRSINGVAYAAGPPIVEASVQYRCGNNISEAEVPDPLQLQCFAILSAGTDTTGLAYIRNFVIQRGGWGHMYTHDWPIGGGAAKAVGTDAFFAAIKLMQDQGLLEVMTVADAWARLGTHYRVAQ